MSVELLFQKDITAASGVVIAILFGYNEQDVVVSTILNALKQGFHVFYVDDFSIDNTRALVQRFFSSDERVGYCMMENNFRANIESEKSWNLKRQLQFKTQLAQTRFCKYQWLLHMDCDEVFECPWATTVVQGLLSLPLSVGKVNCEVRDYFPSSIDNTVWHYDVERCEPMLDITNVLTIYRIRNEANTYYRFLRNTAALDLDFGHVTKTEPDVAHLQKMIMHHYPYRSKELAERKVAQDRLPRISVSDIQTGVGWHYKLLNQMQLPIDMTTANQNVIIVDGRHTTYYLRREFSNNK